MKTATPATGIVRWLKKLTLPIGFGRFEIEVETTKGTIVTQYDIQPTLDADNNVIGFGLAKDDDTVYQIGVSPYGWNCDCKDAQFRNRECKHVRAIKAALKAIGLEVTPPKPEPRVALVTEFDDP